MTNEELILGELRVLRAEVRTDIEKIHAKIDLVHQQTTKTNGRVTSLEKMQDACPGKEALKFVTEAKIKEQKPYQIGQFILTVGATATIVLLFINIFTKCS